MSLRWRSDVYGNYLLCGAKAYPLEGDTYIDDRLHYQLSLIGAIRPDTNENENGRWYWVVGTPYWEKEKN